MKTRFEGMTTRELVAWTINYSGDIAAKTLALDYETVINDLDDLKFKFQKVLEAYQLELLGRCASNKEDDFYQDLADAVEHMEVLCRAI